MSGEKFRMAIFEDDLTASNIVCFKYAYITSVEVERRFSNYKTVLANNSRSFTFENLRMTMVGIGFEMLTKVCLVDMFTY